MKEQSRIKDNKIQFLDSRWYECGDSKERKHVPSITTILQAFYEGAELLKWVKENAEDADDILKIAGEQGSRVHKATECYDLDGHTLDPLMVSQMSMIEVAMVCKYVDFANRYYRKLPLIVEGSFGSAELGFGGTVDRVCELEVDGRTETWLLDIKTSNAVHNHHFAQLSAYGKLINKYCPEVKIQRYGVLHLKTTHRKDSELQGKGWKLYDCETFHDSIKNIDQWFEMFQHAQAMWLLKYKSMAYNEKIFDINIANPLFKIQ